MSLISILILEEDEEVEGREIEKKIGSGEREKQELKIKGMHYLFSQNCNFFFNFFLIFFLFFFNFF